MLWLRLGPSGDDQAVLFEVVLETDLLELALLVRVEVLDEEVADALKLALAE